MLVNNVDYLAMIRLEATFIWYSIIGNYKVTCVYAKKEKKNGHGVP